MSVWTESIQEVFEVSSPERLLSLCLEERDDGVWQGSATVCSAGSIILQMQGRTVVLYWAPAGEGSEERWHVLAIGRNPHGGPVRNGHELQEVLFG